MHFLAVVAGLIAVVSVLADMINTLVTTRTGGSKWWLSRQLGARGFVLVRAVAVRLPDGSVRSALLATFAPLFVLALLVAWVSQQIIGFGLIWWGLGGVDGVESLAESFYYSGVVFFTVGFGEVVPTSGVARTGALIQAFCGVLTTALVIGYLPALYAAYSERERKLMTLDDGSNERITPTNLVMAWSPDGDAKELVDHFPEWEEWVAHILETHSTFPMLTLFRSHHDGQSWITALGLVTDAALHCQLIKGADNRAAYWMLRRSVRLLTELTRGVDLSDYRARFDESYRGADQFRQLYDALETHGFELHPYEGALERNRHLRQMYDARLEYLIDRLVAPRGFWAHEVGEAMDQPIVTPN